MPAAGPRSLQQQARGHQAGHLGQAHAGMQHRRIERGRQHPEARHAGREQQGRQSVGVPGRQARGASGGRRSAPASHPMRNRAGSSSPMWRAMVCSSHGCTQAKAASSSPGATIRALAFQGCSGFTAARIAAGSRPGRYRAGRCRTRGSSARLRRPGTARRCGRSRPARRAGRSTSKRSSMRFRSAVVAHGGEAPHGRVGAQPPRMVGQHRGRVAGRIEAQGEQAHASRPGRGPGSRLAARTGRRRS